jgi:hypothetical protein
VNLKPGFPDLNASDPATESEPVPQSYKRGWPDSTPTVEAIAETLEEVKRLYPGHDILSYEYIQTEEHKEAGEYLIKVLAV